MTNYAKPPFRYDRNGAMIWDSAGNKVLDVRGWGYLTTEGGLNALQAADVQDEFGQRIVDLLNIEWVEPSTKTTQLGAKTCPDTTTP